MDGPASLGLAAVWQAASALMFTWLAIFFGRTLPAGRVPLIERIARVSEPHITRALQRYTRLLTAIWTFYFSLAALAALGDVARHVGAWAGLGSLVLFVGEHRLRPHLFPGESFPGLVQQVRDTWTIWHPRRSD
jgi:uncharacterized membrane protein